MTLSNALIYQKTKQSELHQVKNLNIWGANLEDITILRQCTNVETLSLSVNCISQLEDLQKLNALRELYLRKNKISDLRQICYLSEIPNLQVMWLSDNPIDQDPQYRLYVIRALPHLTKLDEKDVTPEERAAASKTRFSIPHSIPTDGKSNNQQQPTVTPQRVASAKVEQVVKPAYPTNINKTPQTQPPPQQQVYEQVYPEQQPQQQVQQQNYQQPVYQQQPQQYQQPPPQPQYQQPPPQQYYQQPPPPQQQNLYKQSPAVVQDNGQNRKIVLAVLNLIDGLDNESLETIKRQINALIATNK